MRVQFRDVLGLGVLLAGVWLAGCAHHGPPLYATLTLKLDGSHFAGTVVRRDGQTITVTNPSGDTHTFLYAELADIRYGRPESSATSNVQGSGSPPESSARAFIAGASLIQFPAGTEFPVRTSGFLDSCCLPPGALSLGIMESDVEVGGKVEIPQGTNVTIEFLEKKKEDGRISMSFQLASADFGDRHYVFASPKGGHEPGAVVTFTGAKTGSPEATGRGPDVHLEDRTYMGFKAASPILLKASQ